MGKFGFGKDADEESARSGLFGGRKKASNQSDNPYAQNQADDPYANANASPYQQARSGLPSGPRAGGGGRPGLPSGPGPRSSASSTGSGGPPPPYSSQQPPQPSRGYGNEKVGNTGGYGGNRYDDNGGGSRGGSNRPSPAPSGNPMSGGPRAGARGPGGYGGMGGGGGDLDSNRDALFGGAKDRYVPPERKFERGYGQSGASGGSASYDGYGQQRELTEEEQAQQELRDTSQQIRQIRDESLASGLRSLQMIEQSEETARGTLARLGAQGDRLHNTEMNLDRAAIHNRVAEEKTKELKTLNRSMFAVHVSNPFTSKQRAAAREQEVLERHRQDRDVRDQTRKEAYASTQRMEDTFRKAERNAWKGGDSDDENDAAVASKFTFVDDDDEDGQQAAEDMRKEREIRDAEKAMLRGVKKLNYLARAIGDEVDSQNKLITRIGEKVCTGSFYPSTMLDQAMLTISHRAMLSTMVSG